MRALVLCEYTTPILRRACSPARGVYAVAQLRSSASCERKSGERHGKRVGKPAVTRAAASEYACDVRVTAPRCGKENVAECVLLRGTHAGTCQVLLSEDMSMVRYVSTAVSRARFVEVQ